MIPPQLFLQIYLLFLEQNVCTPPKCGLYLEKIKLLIFFILCCLVLINSVFFFFFFFFFFLFFFVCLFCCCYICFWGGFFFYFSCLFRFRFKKTLARRQHTNYSNHLYVSYYALNTFVLK